MVNPCAPSLQMRGIILASRAVVSPRTPSIAEGNSHRGMKFSEKYELLESLTTGAIETFVANDKIRGERVLVHIVECAPQTLDQSAAGWALESFRKLAPEACGPVLETGKYSPPKYAYVVVKPADEATAKAWVRRYELQADETRETKAHTLKKEISAPAEIPVVATPPIAAQQPSQPPGSMTQLLRDYDSLVKSKSPETPSPLDLPPLKPASSTNLPGESGLHAAPAWDQPRVNPSLQSSEPLITEHPIPSRPVAPDASAPSGRNSAKPGEFTNFFQGPFRGDGSSDMSTLPSQPMEPPKKNVGEFTALFGGPTPPSAVTPAATGGSDASFTSIFKDMGTSQPAFNAAPPVQGAVIPPPIPPAPAVPPMNVTPLPDPVFVAPTLTPVVAPTPASAPAFPPSPSAPLEKPVPPRSASLPGEGATNAFMRPRTEPAPVPVEAPSGPSLYTQIISRPKMSEPDESDGGKAPAASASAGKPASPSMPKIPGIAPPPLPKVPPLPKLAPPPVPKLKPPAAPKVPKVDVPAPPPVSVWPLIITLTVLFFLAVILVLYFVLRH